MSLSIWQENRAVALRAKGFPPHEIARVVQADAQSIRHVWPRLVVKEIGASAKADVPIKVTRPAKAFRTEIVGGVSVTPRQIMPVMPPAARALIAEVAEKHGLSVRVMLAPRRLSILVRARDEAMWRLRFEQKRTLARIAKFLGLDDHTTVINGIGSYVERLKKEAA